MSIMQKNWTRRLGAAALTAVAVGAIAIGGAGAAHAASGNSNQGVRNLVVTPDAPNVNFSTPGTPGTMSWNGGDGTAVVNNGAYSLVAGDVTSRTWTVPVGLEIVRSAGDCVGAPNGDYTAVCSLSADKRTYTFTATAARNSTLTASNFNDITDSFIHVVSTGASITGVPTATFTPWTGLTTAAGSATGTVVNPPAAGTPLLAGGIIAGIGLLGAGAVYGVRRKKATA